MSTSNFNASRSNISTSNTPILYSFRRCPYAIRARMALAYSHTSVELREVVLKNKPAELLSLSPKGTVPVLRISEHERLEESLEIMRWALNLNIVSLSTFDLSTFNPSTLNQSTLNQDTFEQSTADYLALSLIHENDHVFKKHLDGYKYADNKQEELQQRQQGEIFLQKLDDQLKQSQYLMGDDVSVVDYAIFPFIRQFAFVDKPWFTDSPYVSLNRWLTRFLDSAQFKQVMLKYPQWNTGDTPLYFPS